MPGRDPLVARRAPSSSPSPPSYPRAKRAPRTGRSNRTRRLRVRWPVGALLLAGLGLAGLLLPARWQGPALVAGWTLARLLALAPLAWGVASLYHGLWRRRTRLRGHVLARPWPSVATAAAHALGVGMLAASWWAPAWWAPVAAVPWGASVVVAAVAATRARW